MKKLIFILIIFLTAGLCYSQDLPSTTVTVYKVKTKVVDRDTIFQISQTIKDTSYVDIRTLKAAKGELQQQKAVYQGYINDVNVRIDAINQRIAELKAQAQ